MISRSSVWTWMEFGRWTRPAVPVSVIAKFHGRFKLARALARAPLGSRKVAVARSPSWLNPGRSSAAARSRTGSPPLGGGDPPDDVQAVTAQIHQRASRQYPGPTQIVRAG